MVRAFEFDRYIEFPKETAYRLHQDGKNLSALKTFLLFFSIMFGFAVISTLFDGEVEYDSYSTLFIFGISLLLRIFYGRLFSESNIRKRLFTLIISGLLVFLFSGILSNVFESKAPVQKTEQTSVQKRDVVISVDEEKGSSNSIIILFSLALLLFRFPKNDIIQLYLLILVLPVITDLVFFRIHDPVNNLIGMVFVIICFSISYTSERKRQTKFYREYDVYHRRHFETIRMKKELDYAREIQLSMLPESSKFMGGLSIAGTSLPANEVGGDYYDYFKISDTKTGIFICDVSGHGVASALLLSGLRSCMHLILEDTSNPKEVFVKLNKMIRRTQNRKMFVTAVFAVVDTENNTCTLFNAGHLPPYKISADSDELFKIRRHGITLGAVDNFEQIDEDNLVTFSFGKGDKLLLYTDGIIEAMDGDKNEYGFERLESYLYENAGNEPSKLLNGLIADVNKFSGNAEQIDDISLLVLSRN